MRDAVAVMEARIAGSRPTGLTKPTKPTKPVGLKEKHYSRVSSKENSTKASNESNAGLEADSKSFERVKNIWNQKSDTGK